MSPTTVELPDRAAAPDILVVERPAGPGVVVETSPPAAGWRAVPWRTIMAAVGIVLAAVAGVQVLRATHHVLLLLVVAGFLAVILNPAVDAVQGRVSSRVLATAIVFTVAGLLVAGLVALFVGPLAPRFQSFLDDLPGMVRRTQAGDGPVADVLRRLQLEERVRYSLPGVRQSVGSWAGPGLTIAKGLVAGAVSLVLLAVLTFMMLLEFPRWGAAATSALPPAAAARARRLARKIGHAVTAYMVGNLITSLVAGTVVGLTMLLAGVPFALVFAVWVALMGFVPQIGGLLAAVPTVLFAFLHSVPAGVIVLVVFLAYQQIENHVLGPMIMSRTVKLRPIWVLVSVLMGAQLLGIVGALLAVPVAAAIQIVAQDVWRHRRSGAGLEVPEDTSSTVS